MSTGLHASHTAVLVAQLLLQRMPAVASRQFEADIPCTPVLFPPVCHCLHHITGCMIGCNDQGQQQKLEHMRAQAHDQVHGPACFDA